MAQTTTRYTVRFLTRQSHNEPYTEVTRTVDATSPDEAMTMVERMGFDYHEAVVEDQRGTVAEYGADVWRDEWTEHEDDDMWTCPECGASMLHWQQHEHTANQHE